MERYGFEFGRLERLLDCVRCVSLKAVPIKTGAANDIFGEESEHQQTTRSKYASELSHRTDEIRPKVDRVDRTSPIELLILKGHRFDTALPQFKSACINLAA
jgi:hypothetical protein